MKTGPKTEYDTKTEDIMKREDKIEDISKTEDKTEDIMKTVILMPIHAILDNISLYQSTRHENRARNRV